MANFQPVSKTTHANKRWKRSNNYTFAKQDTLVPMVAKEMPRALLHLPIGFIKQANGFIPVAVLGLIPGKNLFVALDGNWIGGYTPAAYRGYPFQLANAPDGQQVLVVDEDSGLVAEIEGEPFFDNEGKLSQPLAEFMEFLAQVQKGREQTQKICEKLADYNLMKEWNITLRSESGEKNIEGLFKVDETALNALPADEFETLRQAGVLSIAYCQLLSMQHLPTLGRLVEAHHKAEQLKPSPPDNGVDLKFLNDNGSISFDKF